MLEITSFAAATGLLSRLSAAVAIVVFGAACVASFDMQGVSFACSSSRPTSFHWQDGAKLRGNSKVSSHESLCFPRKSREGVRWWTGSSASVTRGPVEKTFPEPPDFSCSAAFPPRPPYQILFAAGAPGGDGVMEPVGWVIDTVGSRQEEAATGGGKEPSQQSLPGASGEAKATDSSSSQLPRTSTSSFPQGQGRQARTVAAGSDGRDEATSHNSVDSLLRRIARDFSARQARAGNDSVDTGGPAAGRRYHESDGGSSSDRTTRHGRQLEQQPGKRHPPTQGPARRSRWGTPEGDGGFAKTAGGGGGGVRGGVRPPDTAGVASDAAVSVVEANPFTESMWEDTSCRQVLQAMFFAPDSAVPAGPTEEYKELEGERKPTITITITTRPTAARAADTRDSHLGFWQQYKDKYHLSLLSRKQFTALMV